MYIYYYEYIIYTVQMQYNIIYTNIIYSNIIYINIYTLLYTSI